MENYDEDFSTLKAPPSHLLRDTRSLNQWKSDIPLGDGDATLRGGKGAPLPVDDFDDDDFASELESAVRHHKSPLHPTENLPEAFLSDSSSKSPSRASASSTASRSSLSSVPTSWDHDDDLGFDFDDDMVDPKAELAARFKMREQRAQMEAAAETARLTQAAKAKKKLRFNYADRLGGAEEDDLDDALGLDLEQLTLKVKAGTANRNVRLQAPQTPNTQSKLLRGMRSIAQLPNQRSEHAEASPLRPRAAQSMLDLSRGTAPLRQRPLTAYKETAKGSRRLETGNRQRPKQPNLIQNPSHALTRQVRNGMVLNPKTGTWEGNEVDSMRFEAPGEAVRPTLIPQQRVESHQVANNGMIFDNRTLVWVHANEDEYDDPFAGIDEPLAMKPSMSKLASPAPFMQPQTPLRGASSRRFTNESVASVSSTTSTTSAASTAQFGRSVTRPETSSREVFEVSARMAMEWKHADERFMRKFGKWIGGEEERADAMISDQHFYEMLRNT